MPEFIDHIAPVGGSNFYLIEDIYLRGSLRVVPNLSARDLLGVTTLKIGTLVRCADTGIFWRANGIIEGVDEFGDPIAEVDWVEFKFPYKDSLIVPPQRYQVSHFTLNLNIEALADRKSITQSIDLQCYSCFIFDVSVSIPVKLEIFSRQDYKDRNPYTFTARYDHLVDDGTSLIKRKNTEDFWFKTCTYNILVNEEDELDTKFLLRVQKNKKLTKTGKYTDQKVTINFDYIPIEV